MTHASSETDDRTSRIESPSSASRAIDLESIHLESIHLESIHLDATLTRDARPRPSRVRPRRVLAHVDRPRVSPASHPRRLDHTTGSVAAHFRVSRPIGIGVVLAPVVDVVSSVRPGDVLRFTLVDDDAREDDADDGRDDDTRAHKEVRFLEVTATTATTAIGRCRGRRCALKISANETFVTYEESKEVSKRTSRSSTRSRSG